MTKDQKIEYIRAKCIKANPEINVPVVLDCKRKDCTHALHTIGVERPIRLADVLLVMQCNGSEELYMITDGGVFGIDGNGLSNVSWNLRKDDLTLQSEETIDFIHKLL